MSGYNVPEAKCCVVKRENFKYGGDDLDGPSKKPFNLLHHEKKEDHYYYGIRIVTGSEINAGTPDSDVYISLIGTKACTHRIDIVKNWFSSPLGSKTFMDMLIECNNDLGEMQVIILGNPESLLPIFTDKSAWFVDFVDIIDQRTTERNTFPCYHWINDGDQVSFTSKTALVKDVIGNNVLMLQRQAQLDERKKNYTWQTFPEIGLPSAINVSSKDLTHDEQFGLVKNINFTTQAVTAAGTLLFTAAIADIHSLADYEKLANAMTKPDYPTYVNSRWMTDEEFGRQMLNGVNPVIISRCTSLPKNFPVTNDMVKSFLDRNGDLETEMKEGYVYICDLKILDGLPCRQGYYCAAPLCLLYVKKNGQLVPIAIQLKQQPGSDNPIFLPADGTNDWTLAKVYYQSAHAQYHQIATHYLSCHAVMETYGMGVMRNLPDAHPVYKLLRPHFRYTMAINSRARETLINDGGIIDQTFAIGGEGKRELMRRGGAAYNIHWTNIKQSIKERGVDDPNLLPGYYYRDDGLKLWQALEEFVTSVLHQFYASDDDVKTDSELQIMSNDLFTNGFPANGGDQGHGFPRLITSRAQLVELCTLIMFTGSVQHSSINFGQYDMYSYVPNATAGMRLPPPTSKGNKDPVLMQALPDKKTSALLIAIVYALSQYSRDERYFGNFPFERFTETEVQNFIMKFNATLANIGADLTERNKPLEVPYVYMLPTRVTNSITI